MNAINADYIMEFVKRFEELADIKKKERNVRLYLDAPMLRYAIEKFPVHYEVEIMRHGYWKDEGCYNVCSLCAADFDKYDDGGYLQDFDYCPKCGAKMDLKE